MGGQVCIFPIYGQHKWLYVYLLYTLNNILYIQYIWLHTLNSMKLSKMVQLSIWLANELKATFYQNKNLELCTYNLDTHHYTLCKNSNL